MVLLVWRPATAEGKLHLLLPMEAKLATLLLLPPLAETPMEALTCTVKGLQLDHRYLKVQCKPVCGLPTENQLLEQSQHW